MKAGGQKLLLLGAASLLWIACVYRVSAGDLSDAGDYIEFVHDHDSQCVMRNGKMQQVRNSHATRKIKLYLYRFFANKRQPGRTVEVLLPEGEPVSLGCTVIDGSPQHWEIAKARFVGD